MSVALFLKTVKDVEAFVPASCHLYLSFPPVLP